MSFLMEVYIITTGHYWGVPGLKRSWADHSGIAVFVGRRRRAGGLAAAAAEPAFFGEHERWRMASQAKVGPAGRRIFGPRRRPVRVRPGRPNYRLVSAIVRG